LKGSVFSKGACEWKCNSIIKVTTFVGFNFFGKVKRPF
jgi:hypothetical protein